MLVVTLFAIGGVAAAVIARFGDSLLSLGIVLVLGSVMSFPFLNMLESEEKEREELKTRQADERGEASGAYNLGVLLLQRGDLGGAEAAWRRADERGEAAGAYNLGLLSQQRGDLAGAEAAWRSVEECGDLVGAAAGAYNLGVVLHQRGDPAGAEAAWRRGDQHQEAKDASDLGMRLKQQGDLEGAEAALRRAADGGDGHASCSLAGLLAGRGDLEGAKAAWQYGVEGSNVDRGFDLHMLLISSTPRYRHPADAHGMFLPMIRTADQLHGLARLGHRAQSWGEAARTRSWAGRRRASSASN